MFEKLSELLKDLFDADTEEDANAHRTALAALLIHASRIDGHEDPEETARLNLLLENQFDLSPAEREALVEEGRERDAEAVDLYGFTSALTDRLDQEGRCKVVTMLWEIVLADGRLDDYEANLVWRVAELLGVSTRDRVELRRAVEMRLGIA
jgi:uncharacterized tellurite resistance protein B-like protein